MGKFSAIIMLAAAMLARTAQTSAQQLELQPAECDELTAMELFRYVEAHRLSEKIEPIESGEAPCPTGNELLEVHIELMQWEERDLLLFIEKEKFGDPCPCSTAIQIAAVAEYRNHFARFKAACPLPRQNE